MGDTTSAAVSAKAGQCSVALQCSLPHVQVDATCKKVSIAVDAIGRDATIPVMPTFLDGLISGLNQTITGSSTSPQAVFRAAETSRVTRHVLKKTYSGKKFDPKLESIAFAGAASSGMLAEQHAAIVRAYDALGAATVRRFWLLVGPLFLLFAAWSATSDLRYDLVRLLRTPHQVVGYVFYGADAAVAVLPLVLLAFLCGRLARRSVRRATHSRAKRKPRQWPWPQTLLVLGAMAHYVPIYQGYTTPDAQFFRGAFQPIVPVFLTSPLSLASIPTMQKPVVRHLQHRHPFHSVPQPPQDHDPNTVAQ